MARFAVEKGVAVTAIKHKKQKNMRNSKYPFYKMDVGDSFCVKDISERNTAFRAAKYYGLNVVTRQQPDGEYRIWRVA